MDARRKRWVENVIAACDRALERYEMTSDPHARDLVEDIQALRDDLREELNRGLPSE